MILTCPESARRNSRPKPEPLNHLSTRSAKSRNPQNLDRPTGGAGRSLGEDSLGSSVPGSWLLLGCMVGDSMMSKKQSIRFTDLGGGRFWRLKTRWPDISNQYKRIQKDILANQKYVAKSNQIKRTGCTRRANGDERIEEGGDFQVRIHKL